MSIEVAPNELSTTLARFPFVYRLTVGEQPRPHLSALSARVVDGAVVVPGSVLHRPDPPGPPAREEAGVQDCVELSPLLDE